jgi:tRNA U34 5-methylaminomethyl-2-thiouridine-forming methyltransferase MnmC
MKDTPLLTSSPPTLLMTEDGTHTLFLSEMNETYHSHAGALTESIHVYIQNGYAYAKEVPQIRVLEVGLGTGLNAILTAEEAVKQGKQTCYHSLEPYPLSPDMISQLSLGYIHTDVELGKQWRQIHAGGHAQTQRINPFFECAVFNTTLQEFESPNGPYHVIYYDAFAPRKQPEMWMFEALEKCSQMLLQGGIFITYCANGQFKRNLKQLGFELSNPPGIKGRKEITRGIKI